MKEGEDPIWFHNNLGKGILYSLPNYKQLSLRSKHAFVNMTGLVIGHLGKTFSHSQYAGTECETRWMQRLVNELLPNFHTGTELPHFLQNYLPTAAPDLAQAVESIANGFAVKGFTMHFIDNLQNLTRAELARAYSQGGSGPLLPLEKIPSEMLASSPISVQFSGNGQVLFSGFSAGALINFLQAPDAKHHYLCAHPYLVLMATIRHLVLFRSASKDPEPQQAGLAGRLLGLFSPPPRPVPAQVAWL